MHPSSLSKSLFAGLLALAICCGGGGGASTTGGGSPPPQPTLSGWGKQFSFSFGSETTNAILKFDGSGNPVFTYSDADRGWMPIISMNSPEEWSTLNRIPSYGLPCDFSINPDHGYTLTYYSLSSPALGIAPKLAYRTISNTGQAGPEVVLLDLGPYDSSTISPFLIQDASGNTAMFIGVDVDSYSNPIVPYKIYYVCYKNPDGTWQTPIKIDTTSVTTPVVPVNDPIKGLFTQYYSGCMLRNGDIIFAWIDHFHSGYYPAYLTRYSKVNGTLTTIPVAPAAMTITATRDESDDVMLAWTTMPEEAYQSALYTSGGTLLQSQSIYTPGSGHGVVVPSVVGLGKGRYCTILIDQNTIWDSSGTPLAVSMVVSAVFDGTHWTVQPSIPLDNAVRTTIEGPIRSVLRNNGEIWSIWSQGGQYANVRTIKWSPVSGLNAWEELNFSLGGHGIILDHPNIYINSKGNIIQLWGVQDNSGDQFYYRLRTYYP